MAAVAHSLGSVSNSVSRRGDGAVRRVLYAEDQISSRVVTTAMLQRMGFEVDAVDDGELAVERARDGSYDIILLDIEMPIMDGVTAARTMRAELEWCRNTPILALSAFLADSTEHCVWRDAFDSAVPKPANSNELKKALSKAMAMHAIENTAIAPLGDTSLTIWQSMQKHLAPGMVQQLARTAGDEMVQLALGLAAAREANDAKTVVQFRHGLIGLCRNFELEDVASLLSNEKHRVEAINMSAIFALIGEWQRRHGVLSN
jgi:CheY-like chemotaxis protein